MEIIWLSTNLGFYLFQGLTNRFRVDKKWDQCHNKEQNIRKNGKSTGGVGGTGCITFHNYKLNQI